MTQNPDEKDIVPINKTNEQESGLSPDQKNLDSFEKVDPNNPEIAEREELLAQLKSVILERFRNEKKLEEAKLHLEKLEEIQKILDDSNPENESQKLVQDDSDLTKEDMENIMGDIEAEYEGLKKKQLSTKDWQFWKFLGFESRKKKMGNLEKRYIELKSLIESK